MNKFLKGPMLTQGMLFARVLVGGYLVYLSYSLINERENGSMNPTLLWGAVIVFALVGAFLVVKGLYSYATGYYKGGKLDTSTEEEPVTEEADTETSKEEPADASTTDLPEEAALDTSTEESDN